VQAASGFTSTAHGPRAEDGYGSKTRYPVVGRVAKLERAGKGPTPGMDRAWTGAGDEQQFDGLLKDLSPNGEPNLGLQSSLDFASLALLRQIPAVYCQFNAGNVRRLIRGQEQVRVRHLLDAPFALHRHRRDGRGAHLRIGR
jgi:hypothetical protein